MPKKKKVPNKNLVREVADIITEHQDTLVHLASPEYREEFEEFLSRFSEGTLKDLKRIKIEGLSKESARK